METDIHQKGFGWRHGSTLLQDSLWSWDVLVGPGCQEVGEGVEIHCC